MNKAGNLSENEYNLLVAVESSGSVSQRELAGKLKVSLGLINICLHRLSRKGYIKIQGLNARKVKYMLTPRGFTEKMRKTYHYTQKTIKELSCIRQSIKSEVERSILLGERNFTIEGAGELSDIAELAVKNLKQKGLRIRRINNGGRGDFIVSGGKKIAVMDIIMDATLPPP
ncbi:MAG: winged helix-turn-helix transcriptional regulator [bacterium]